MREENIRGKKLNCNCMRIMALFGKYWALIESKIVTTSRAESACLDMPTGEQSVIKRLNEHSNVLLRPKQL